MNKRPNPFQPTFQSPQPPQPHGYPPLPPGPPPPPSVNQHQQEWAAYWAAQGAGAGPYPQNPPAAWAPPQGGQQPPAYDPALYRNYGYGGQNPAIAAGWQQPGSHPPAGGHPQYPRPQAYPQQYPHTAYPQYPPTQPPGVHGMATAPQPMPYGPQYPYPAPQMPGIPQQRAPPPTSVPPPMPQQPPHHASTHQQPPAKRPRFDSNAHANSNANIPPRPSAGLAAPTAGQSPQQVQPPPLHFKPGGGMVPANQLNSSNGTMTVTKYPLPTGPAGNSSGPRGGGVALGLPGRGGGGMGRGGGRGGMGGGRSGRGGGPMHGHSGPGGGGMGRGGNMGGRGNFGNAGRPGSRGSSFRQNQIGRYQGPQSNSVVTQQKSHHPPTGPASSRHDRSRPSAHASEISAPLGNSVHGLPSSSFNFSPSNAFRGASPFTTGKRTLTDFRIIGFGVSPLDSDAASNDDTLTALDWTWGAVALQEKPAASVSNASSLEGMTSAEDVMTNIKKEEPVVDMSSSSDGQVDSASMRISQPPANSIPNTPTPRSPAASRPTNFKLSSTNSIPIAPRHQRKPNEPIGRSETSRIRFYFQCPAELDERETSVLSISPSKARIWTVPLTDRVINGSSTSGDTGTVGIGGKRKKDLTEDEDDLDEDSKHRDGGKRKREDSNLLSEANPEGPAAAADGEPASPNIDQSSTLTPQATAVALTDGEASPTVHDEQATTTSAIADKAAGEELISLSEGDFREAAMPQADQESVDISGDGFDIYNDVDAEGEDEGASYPQDQETMEEWANEMSWSVDGQTPADHMPSTAVDDDLVSNSMQPSGDNQALVDTPKVTVTQADLPVADGSTNQVPFPTSSPTASSPSLEIEEYLKVETTSVVADTQVDASQASTDVGAVPVTPNNGEISTVNMPTSDLPLKEEDRSGDTADSNSSTATTSSVPLPSPNRISISYAGSARRLVIDADVIESVKIRRAEGRIDVILLLDYHDDAGDALRDAGSKVIPGDDVLVGAHEQGDRLGGAAADAADGSTAADVANNPAVREPAVKDEELPIKLEEGSQPDTTGAPTSFSDSAGAIEALDESTQAYRSVSHSTYETDATIPPFPKYLASAPRRPLKARLVLYLDKDKPLSEPKWVKTGDIEDWLKSMFGPSKPDPQNYASWSGKILIADPDAPPNVYALIDSWVPHSVIGPPKERRRFVNEHVKANFDNVLEILLRLVRREGPGSGSGSINPQSMPFGSPLAAALSSLSPSSPGGSSHIVQQTHVSLAVLSLFRMAAEYAALAGVETTLLENRVGQIVRSLPQNMVYKSLDGMFKEWMSAQKKGGGGGSQGRGSG